MPELLYQLLHGLCTLSRHCIVSICASVAALPRELRNPLLIGFLVRLSLSAWSALVEDSSGIMDCIGWRDYHLLAAWLVHLRLPYPAGCRGRALELIQYRSQMPLSGSSVSTEATVSVRVSPYMFQLHQYVVIQHACVASLATDCVDYVLAGTMPAKRRDDSSPFFSALSK